jgi:hypothetical protein
MLTCASGSTGETDDGEVGNDAAQGRVVRRDACQRKTPPGQRMRLRAEQQELS